MLLKFLKKYIPLVFFISSLIFLSKVLLLTYFPDFSTYYDATKQLISGINPYISNEDFFAPFIYPPFSFFIFYPLILFSFEISGKIWTLLSIIFLLISVSLICRIYNKNLFNSTNLILVGILFFTFFPTKFTLGMGQINIFILLFSILALYFYYLGQKKISAVFLGISIAIKFFPIILLAFFYQEERI